MVEDTHQSEYELEEQLMRKLSSTGYKKVEIGDVDALTSHFRHILNQRNAAKLNHKPLSDAEFKRVETELRRSAGIFETGKLLRGTDIAPQGVIIIQRDNDETIYLNIFDGVDHENNIYEVTHQIKNPYGKHENRYDVTILMNGLPVTQIELKRRGVEFSQAFNQILRYRTESLNANTSFLFNFIQLFVISNGIDTRYFANGDGTLNSNFTFYWTDEKNNWINDLDLFTISFLEPKRLHSMISKYTIFDDAHHRMIIMRPYQVFAVEAIIKQAQENPDRNGYIWHTTGSGKTITSFKAARILSQDRQVKANNVIFLIDRSDLDIQTVKNFKSYLPDESALDTTDNTATLVRQLTDTGTQLIVTTIQKLNNAVSNDRYKNVLTPFHDQKVIFIEDEAHRSQFGEMRKNVNKWFGNAQHFGFTGTPIFKENIGIDGRTTDDLYDDRLHTYLIKDAIRDRNVLAFNVEYINTIKGHDFVADADKEYKGLEKTEVWEDEERLDLIAQHILLNHSDRTNKRLYNAVFTVPNTRIALKYYDLFKKLKTDLNITTIFTWAANEQDNEGNQNGSVEDTKASRLGLDDVISDYNVKYGTNFSTDAFSDYFADVSKRMKAHNQATPTENIDILIVVNMFLTGFDSPKLSTLYVDKKLQYHSLIQAFSRTNRVEQDTKTAGNIVVYRNLKQNTDDAVMLYSDGDKEAFFAPTYDELKGKFSDAIVVLKDIAPTVQSADQLANLGDDELMKYVLAFREVWRLYNRIHVYDDFDWGQFTDFGEQELEDYRGKYFTIYDDLNKHIGPGEQPKTSILDDIDFHLELVAQDVINVQYIVRMIQTIEPKVYKDSDVARAKRIIANSNLKTKGELLADFLDEVLPKLSDTDDTPSALNKYLRERLEAEINQYVDESELPKEFVDEQINEYTFDQKFDEVKIVDELSRHAFPFLVRKKIKNGLKAFVANTYEKYHELLAS